MYISLFFEGGGRELRKKKKGFQNIKIKNVLLNR
jgi:hypothetical protein